ncbi:hypothetical protein M2T82_18555 [Elizabethkingia ursingii]|uniref:hypothetical protein n=1 Tax=Elizabethkingia ursingii TaxID=1756150 RepID=UPI002013510A|nr:hypothetical protein [Elizabethkingia ursingii]MCL1670069.1 hypothetical protein [Elizabethkingia ursingii]
MDKHNKPVIYYINTIHFLDYLIEYVEDNTKEALFRKIEVFEKNIKYIVKTDQQERHLIENIELYESYDFDIFKEVFEFSINYLERSLLLKNILYSVERYEPEDIKTESFFSIINPPEVAYSRKSYVFEEIEDEEEMYHLFNTYKNGFISFLTEFLFYSYIIDKLNNLSHKGLFKITKEIEPLTISQKCKIGLLYRSGIIDFLREKYPKITNNQIAGFFDLITQEHMKKTSINTHFTQDTESSKYPIQNKQDEIELDIILTRYGMNLF